MLTIGLKGLTYMNRKESENFFDFIRYFAAFCVMYLHYTGHVGYYYTSQSANQVATLRGISTFFQPTVVLLTIAGFLASASFERYGERAGVFLKKRIARIYIDMWLSMAVYVAVFYFVVGKRYDSSMIKWAIIQGLGFANTPDCLKNFATGSMNGTMWFFTVIIQLYIVLPFVKKALKRYGKKLTVWLVVVAVLGVLNIASGFLAPQLSETWQKLLERTFIPYAFWFFVGVMFHTCELYKKDHIRKAAIALLAVQIGLNFLPASGIGYYTDFLRGTVTCLLTIAAAYSLPTKRARIDVTYGMYLYHWLFINLIIHFKHYERFGFVMNVLTFTAGTLVCANVFRLYARVKNKI